MLREIHLRQAGVVAFANGGGGDLLQDGETKQQVLTRTDLRLNAAHRGVEQILLPFGLPTRLKFRHGCEIRILRRTVARRGFRFEVHRGMGTGFSPMPRQPSPDHGMKPGLERPSGRIVTKSRHLLGDHHQGLLHHILRLRLRQTGPSSHRIDQSPIGFKKLAPPLLIFPVLETAQ